MNPKTIGIALVVAAVAVLGFLALRGNTSTSPQANDSATQPGQASPQPSGQVETTDVEIKGFAFGPSSITVKKGATVTWTNRDSAAHNVVTEEGAPAGGPKGPLFGQNQTFSFTFDTAGTFPYFCEPHPFMKGTVIVTD